MRSVGNVAGGGKGDVHTGIFEKRKVKRPLVRPRRCWKNAVRRDLQEIEWRVGGECIDLAQVRDRWQNLVSTVMILRAS
jgi:hypothetical protein